MKLGWHGCETSSFDETIENGKKFAKYLEKGDILALQGELASGKTTFTKGILKGLNYTKPVTSPTFTLVNEYHADCKVVHIDCYREENINRWLDIGIYDYCSSENIVIIEWADKILSLLPANFIDIKLFHVDKNRRKIIIINK